MTPRSDALIRDFLVLFHRDWESFVRVEVTDELNGYIQRAVKRYPLRGFDAIRLASAMAVHEQLHEGFVFACFDDRLARAARLKEQKLAVVGWRPRSTRITSKTQRFNTEKHASVAALQ